METMRSKPRIAIIGGGFGGMLAGIQVDKQLGAGSSSYTIFDGNSNFGGTWQVNNYPGCACDIPSHLYSFSFELNPNWSQTRPPQPEIREYMHKIAQKYNLYSRTRFSTSVKEILWLEKEKQWKLQVQDKNSGETEELLFHYVIVATGRLRTPLIPSEFKGFKGRMIHSAEWNANLEDLRGKRVGVVGSGASAIQIIPSIAPYVKELHSYQRKPAWVTPRSQVDIPRFIKKVFELVPFIMWLYRVALFIFMELRYRAFQDDSFFNYCGTLLAMRHMKSELQDAKLIEKLTPNYKFGCKRVLVSSNYFPTFKSPHVHIHREKIEGVVGSEIRVAGDKKQELDVLILATGFHVHEYFAPLQIKTSKMNLLSKWKMDGPSAYLGIMSHAVPNLFFVSGPNTGLGHNSAIFMMECQVNCMLQIIRKATADGATSVEVKQKSEDEWMERMEEDFRTAVWEKQDCGSWYKDSKGKVTTLWPKTCTEYWWKTRTVNYDNFQWTF